MGIQDVYKLIRTEETILWIGAGFSKYAGYPTGDELRKRLIISLEKEEQPLFHNLTSLKEFSEYFAVLKGRDKLEQHLLEIFSENPIDTYFHDLLSHISHFKTIITTNYDQLIENSFSKKGVAIRNGTDFSKYVAGQAKIFKIHGCVTLPTEMVITSSDYAKMHNRFAKDSFWSSLIAEITSKHVIFLGYGYEDENIWSDFDAVYSQIGATTKKRFMISPGIDQIKRERLRQQNIELIEMGAETFLPDLIDELKKHIVGDMEQKLVPSQIAVDFITSFDLKVKLDHDLESVKLLSMQKTSGPTSSKLEFSMKDQELIKEYRKVLEGESGLTIEFDKDQLTEFKHLVEGFQLTGSESVAKFSLQLQPNYVDKCKIEFPEENFKSAYLPFKVYGFKNQKLRAVCQYHKFDISVDMLLNSLGPLDLKFNFAEPKNFTSVRRYKEAYLFFKLLMGQNSIEITLKKSKRVIRQKLSYISLTTELDHFHRVYCALATIEDTFKVKFKNARTEYISFDVIEKINKLIALISKGYHAVVQNEGLSILIDQDLQKAIDRPIPEGAVFLMEGQSSHYELLGVNLELGVQQVIVPNPLKFEIIKENELIAIRDKNNIIVYKYERFGVEKVDNPEVIWRPKRISKTNEK